MIDLDNLLEFLNEKRIQYNIAKKAIIKNTIEISKNKNIISKLQIIKSIIINVGKETQKNILEYIQETVTLAIQTVFGNEYEFQIKSNYDKREQLEIHFLIVHFGIPLEPRKDTCEGGVIDICAFALRIVCLTLETKDIPYILILDEPFKNVSAKFIPAVGQMIVDISKLLNIQIIMVTHITEFIEVADNLIYL